MNIYCILLLIGIISTSASYARQSAFDKGYIDSAQARNSIIVIKNILQKDTLSAADIKSLYFHEVIIGKYLGNMTHQQIISWPNRIDNYEYEKGNVAVFNDCIKYVQLNRNYFRIVDDNWKGENNFWEPTRYWLYRIQMKNADSYEAKEVEYDLDFKEFIREFDIDKESKGLDCEAYIKNITSDGSGEMYREIYSDDDIKTWVPECKEAREKFRIGRNKLLLQYQNAPFTKQLQEIDETEIVVFHSVC